MMDIKCPLCGTLPARAIEKVDADEIDGLFHQRFGFGAGLKIPFLTYLKCDHCQLGFFDPMATGDENLYEQLQQADWYYMNDKPEYALAERYLPIEGFVLEVGSGKGAFSRIVGKERYIGLEFNDEAIKQACEEGITLLKESIEVHAKKNPHRYDVVVSFQVLEHVSNPSSFIQGCVEALKEDGHLILAVPNHDGLCGFAQNNFLDMPPHHVSHWSEKTMQHIAHQYNLALTALECEPVANFHTQWAIRSIHERRIRSILGVKTKLLDISLSGRLFGKLAAIMARISSPDLSAVKGHTILACYRKH